VDIIYNRFIIEPALSIGLQTSKVLDRGVIELLGPYGLSNSIYYSSTRLSSLDTGSISTYGLYIFVGLVSLVAMLFLPFILHFSFNFGLIIVLSAGLFYIPSTDESINDSQIALK
jgi:NADH-ubiquinone oxidoreductase chain 5